MKGIILDYNFNDAFVLLDNDSIITIPLASLKNLAPIGSNISLNSLYSNYSNINYKSIQAKDKTIDFL